MWSVESLGLEPLLAFLSQHREWAYGVLFLGALFETLIPFSLVVLGEVFFLAGAVLAGVGTLELGVVAATLYGGGLLGDHASYWLGRRWGSGLLGRLAGWPWVGRWLHPDQYDKGVALFQRHGAWAVFGARLAGPLSWVMPALAGTYRLDYPTFALFNALGIFLGIGQFLLLGYLFGSQIDAMLAWLDRHTLPLAAAAGFTLLAALLARHWWRQARAGG